MDPAHPEQDYHPDPKSADKIHDSGTELHNIADDARADEAKIAPAIPEASEAPETLAQPETPEVPETPVKPHKRGKLIALIIAIVVVLCGAGTAAGLMIWRNQPEMVAMDAMVNYLNTRTLRAAGAITVELQDNPQVEQAMFLFDVEGSGLEHRLSGLLSIRTKDDGDIGLSFKEAFTKDHELYFQIDQIQEIIEQLGLEFNDDIAPILTSFADTIDLVDGTWWRVSLPELLDDFGDQLSTSDRRRYQKVYSCTMSALEQGVQSGELADIYREHPFVTVSKYQGHELDNHFDTNGQNLYEVDFKVSELQDFLKADFSELTVYQDIKTCFADADLNLSEFLQNVETNLDTNPDATLDYTIVMDIDYWQHRINNVYFVGTDSESGSTLWGDLSLLYPESVTITAPDNARPVSDLVEQVFTDLSKIMYTSIDESYYFQVD